MCLSLHDSTVGADPEHVPVREAGFNPKEYLTIYKLSAHIFNVKLHMSLFYEVEKFAVS